MTDPHFHISTPRLYLSYFQPENDSHCDFLVKLYNTPEFIASSGKTEIETRENAREDLQGRTREFHARNGRGTYLVSLRPSNGDTTTSSSEEEPFSETILRCKPIGAVSLLIGHEPGPFTALDLGFAIIPDEMRKGYARGAAEHLLKYVKSELGIVHVMGLHDPENVASAAVFRSLGFEDRGLHVLKPFGGVSGSVWTTKGMAEDLSTYGIGP